jgi:hypothetical protein
MSRLDEVSLEELYEIKEEIGTERGCHTRVLTP